MKTKILPWAITLLLFISCTSDDSVFSNETPPENLSSIEQEIFTLINNYRASINKTPLAHNTIAYQEAFKHNQYMISQNAISHDNFDDRFSKLVTEVSANSVGENVARYYTTAQEVVNAWIESPSHKENIEGNFSHTGISAIKDNQGRYYFTQLFYK